MRHPPLGDCRAGLQPPPHEAPLRHPPSPPTRFRPPPLRPRHRARRTLGRSPPPLGTPLPRGRSRLPPRPRRHRRRRPRPRPQRLRRALRLACRQPHPRLRLGYLDRARRGGGRDRRRPRRSRQRGAARLRRARWPRPRVAPQQQRRRNLAGATNARPGEHGYFLGGPRHPRLRRRRLRLLHSGRQRPEAPPAPRRHMESCSCLEPRRRRFRPHGRRRCTRWLRLPPHRERPRPPVGRETRLVRVPRRWRLPRGLLVRPQRHRRIGRLLGAGVRRSRRLPPRRRRSACLLRRPRLRRGARQPRLHESSARPDGWQPRWLVRTRAA